METEIKTGSVDWFSIRRLLEAQDFRGIQNEADKWNDNDALKLLMLLVMEVLERMKTEKES